MRTQQIPQLCKEAHTNTYHNDTHHTNTHSRLRQRNARPKETLCKQGGHSSNLEKQSRFPYANFSYFFSKCFKFRLHFKYHTSLCLHFLARHFECKIYKVKSPCANSTYQFLLKRDTFNLQRGQVGPGAREKSSDYGKRSQPWYKTTMVSAYPA